MAKSSSKKTLPQNSKKQTVKNSSKESDQQFKTNADTSFQDLFISELRDIYWAENHLIKSLPKMVDAAASGELKQALAEHLEVTKTHAARLENIFELLSEKVIAKKCDAMEGLVMSGEHVIENTSAETQTRNTGIIMSALKVENFEITTYNGLIQAANFLDKSNIADLLQQNLDEEIEASDILTELSQSGLNKTAS